ncbi:hypothetical protein [Cytobacillus kochii]|uniref:hypothetical protein n=1 Tax=Cytobacillus kochii TaxID=859143 RepID=UPI003F80EBA8
MTNNEKMKELLGMNVSKQTIIQWANMNNIHVGELALEKGFEKMFNSVESFCNSQTYVDGFIDQQEMWEKFLDSHFVS